MKNQRSRLTTTKNITRRGSIYVSRPCAQGAAFFFIPHHKMAQRKIVLQAQEGKRSRRREKEVPKRWVRFAALYKGRKSAPPGPTLSLEYLTALSLLDVLYLNFSTYFFIWSKIPVDLHFLHHRHKAGIMTARETFREHADHHYTAIQPRSMCLGVCFLMCPL